MKYKGYDLSNIFVEETITQSILSPLETKSVKAGGKHGEIFLSNTFGIREIKVGVRYFGRRYDHVRTAPFEIAPKLFSTKPEKLELDLIPGKYFMAIVDGSTDWTRVSTTGTCEITFLCHDPFAYGATYTQGLSGGSYVVATGTYETAPVFSFKPVMAIDQVGITNATTGDSVILTKQDGKFLVSDNIQIDCGRHYVTVNGKNAMKYLDISSNFFTLTPDVKTLIYIRNGKGTMTYTERFL